MAHRERKQLNFSTIVDFSLSKQGVFFVTLRQGNLLNGKLPFFVFIFTISLDNPCIILYIITNEH